MRDPKINGNIGFQQGNYGFHQIQKKNTLLSNMYVRIMMEIRTKFKIDYGSK